MQLEVLFAPVLNECYCVFDSAFMIVLLVVKYSVSVELRLCSFFVLLNVASIVTVVIVLEVSRCECRRRINLEVVRVLSRPKRCDRMRC